MNKEVSLKKNFIYNSIVTVSNYAFSLIIFPYINRVLGVSNIGICSFVDNVIDYFVLFSMMGIGTIGIREIAANKEEQGKLNETFSNLILLNAAFTVVSCLLLLICIFTIDKFRENQTLMLIGVFKLCCNFFLLEWLYRGLEDFKYITKRTVIIKVFYLVAIFTFIKEPSDYQLYYILTAVVIACNALVNLHYSRKKVKLQFNRFHFTTYLKPVILFGLYMILTTMYVSFNTVFLGFVSTDREVGYFSTASKLTMIFFAIYTAWTNVAMPRMSALHAHNNLTEFRKIIYKSSSLLFSFSIPIVILCCIFTPDIINIIAGKGYEGAVIPLRVQIPLIFIIGYSQILVIQILIPLKKDNTLTVIAGMGAFVGVMLNVWLTSRYDAIGASISWLLAEIVIIFAAQWVVSKNMHILFPLKQLFKVIISYVPFLLVCLWLYNMSYISNIGKILIALFLILAYTVVIQYHIIKDETFLYLCNKVMLFAKENKGDNGVIRN
ncbi:flippase [Hoylesella saccharolytica]|uniref:flippase n=1 Tax=Hoylesella saccharolytica TaxID=633701 RepID=UPI00046FA6E3|nr:flippase [Hoylesella saccharolytica]